jgi:hypothetical protein
MTQRRSDPSASYDLIGLPPTYAELMAFVESYRHGASSPVVDRLLASPHYGSAGAVSGSIPHATPTPSAATAATGTATIANRTYVSRLRHRAFNQDKPRDHSSSNSSPPTSCRTSTRTKRACRARLHRRPALRQ